MEPVTEDTPDGKGNAPNLLSKSRIFTNKFEFSAFRLCCEVELCDMVVFLRFKLFFPSRNDLFHL